jgi:hypothetical protein
MSGSYPDTAAATESTDTAAVAAGVASATARVAESQAQAAHFIAENGSSVVAGHGQVGVVPPSLTG